MTENEWWIYLQAWMISYGIAFTAALTDGPFGVFKRFRRVVAQKWPIEWVKTGVSCPVCVGFWVSAVVTACIGGGVMMWLTSVGFICLVVSLSPD